MKQKCGWEVERDQEGVKDGDDYGKRHQKLIVFGKKILNATTINAI
jgi:hypothetical protein